MNKISNPLDYLLSSCETTLSTGVWKLDKFLIENAKDELKRLKNKIKEITTESFKANQFAAEEISRNLEYQIVGYARVNDRGDIYDLRLSHNTYLNESTLIPLYANLKEFQDKNDKLSK